VELVRFYRVSIIYRTTLTPGKLELVSEWLPTRTWYRVTGRPPELVRAGGFRLDDPEGEVGIEFMVAIDESGAQPVTYHVPMTYRGLPLDGADDYLIGTSEHGVLGRRWIYDGTRDPVLVTQLVALIQGESEAQAQSQSHTPDRTVHSRRIPAEPVTATSFTAVDGVRSTEVSIVVAAASVGAGGGAGAGGASPAAAMADPAQLVIQVPRVLDHLTLEPIDGLRAIPEVSWPAHGSVTATWQGAGVGQVRGVFALAELR
jgi:Maltokinase N-terminal cap domain